MTENTPHYDNSKLGNEQLFSFRDFWFFNISNTKCRVTGEGAHDTQISQQNTNRSDMKVQAQGLS